MEVKYPYLDQQFADVEDFFEDLRKWVPTGEFTLGSFVDKFEKKFAEYIGVKHAIGTNTGTDALILALKGVGVKPGDEVITVPNTFIATVGAIVAVGGKPVFVDCDKRMQIDSNLIEAAITPNTKAIVPVHWTGCPADLEPIMAIATKHDLKIVEDACPSVGAEIDGKRCGSFGDANGFSMHPLKPLNVWGDGGIVVTNDDATAEWLRLYHNHGLLDRNHIEFWGVNARLQPFQAIIATRLLDTVDDSNNKRIRNARILDEGLKGLEEHIITPPRSPKFKEVYQLTVALATRRDELLQFMVSKGVDCKVHYPIPLHLQNCAKDLGYKKGDFPECENQTDEIITIPAHQYVTEEQMEYIVETIHSFY